MFAPLLAGAAKVLFGGHDPHEECVEKKADRQTLTRMFLRTTLQRMSLPALAD